MRNVILLALIVVTLVTPAWSLCEKREYAELMDMDEKELIEAIKENVARAKVLIQPGRTNNPEQGIENGTQALQCLAICNDYNRQLKKRYKYSDKKLKQLNNKLDSTTK